MKIGVLMGGNSSERDVSMATGQAMATAVASLGYDAVPIVLNESIEDILPIIKQMNMVLIALHGGEGENGIIQGMLELLDIPYSGSDPLSSGICMDKHVSKVLVEAEGIATPKWIQLQEKDPVPHIDFSLPWVVKPVDQGSTVGLTIVKNAEDLQTALDASFSVSERTMIEAYVEGRELTVTVLEDKAYPIVEIIPSHELYDYECKYSKGLSQYTCPAVLPDGLASDIKSTSENIFKVLKCRHYGRVDFRLDNQGTFWFLEINTLPGMTETSLVPKSVKAAGMSFESLVETLIKRAMD